MIASERRCVVVDRQCRESEGRAKIEGYMSISDEEAHQQCSVLDARESIVAMATQLILTFMVNHSVDHQSMRVSVRFLKFLILKARERLVSSDQIVSLFMFSDSS